MMMDVKLTKTGGGDVVVFVEFVALGIKSDSVATPLFDTSYDRRTTTAMSRHVNMHTNE
jgi:hypothetical protein